MVFFPDYVLASPPVSNHVKIIRIAVLCCVNFSCDPPLIAVS